MDPPNFKSLSRHLSPRVQKVLKSLQITSPKSIDEKKVNKKVHSFSQRISINTPLSTNEFECQVKFYFRFEQQIF